jgi:hypothetical protein
LLTPSEGAGVAMLGVALDGAAVVGGGGELGAATACVGGNEMKGSSTKSE